MKDKKQQIQAKQNKKRRTALFFAIFGGLAAAGATAALVATLTSHGNSPVHTLNLTFEQGSGTKIEGKTKVEFEDSTTLNKTGVPYAEKKYTSPTGEINYRPFVGWRIKGTKTQVPYNQQITQSLNLVATFSDELEEEGITYHTIIFERSDETVWLTGMTRMAVEDNFTLAMINRPEPHTSDTTKTHFQGWALKSDPQKTVLSLNFRITADMVLIPVYVQAVDVKFNPLAGTLIGQDTIKAKVNTLFGSLNTPSVTPPSNYMFEGWYKVDPTGKTEAEIENQKWLASDVIPAQETVNAYAYYVDQTASGYCRVNFVQSPESGQPTITFEGNTNISIKQAKTWADCTRPNPIKEGWVVHHWEYSTDYNPTDPSTATWTELKDDFSFSSYENIYVAPIMIQNVQAVKLLGDATLKVGQTKKYMAWAIPTGVATAVTFSLHEDEGCEKALSSDVATIVDAQDDICGIKAGTSAKAENAVFWLKATSKIDSTKFDKMKVTVQPAIAESSDYMIFEELVSGEGAKWYSLKNVNKGGQPIYATELSDEETNADPIKIDRDKFNYPVYVGDRVTKVVDAFLNNCSAFNSKVIFSNKTVNIGYNFLVESGSFTGHYTDKDGKEQSLLDLSGIQNIDNHFLTGCTSFNTPVSFNGYTIGESFLSNCSTFNSKIDLGNNIKIISSTDNYAVVSHFLWGCKAFNQDITFPATLERVGTFVMYDCNAFTSDIKVNCAPEVFKQEPTSFASTSAESDIYNKGFTFSSDTPATSAKMIKNFGNSSKAEPASYRTVTQKAGLNGVSWDKVVDALNTYEAIPNPTMSDAQAFLNKLGKPGTAPVGDPGSLIRSEMIGVMGNVIINGISHKVRVIDADHDQLASDTSKNATLTIQFAEVLTNSDGTAMTSIFAPTNSLDYSSSTLRANLTGEGSGTASWSKSALDMLKQENPVLATALKKVNKQFAKGTTTTAPAYNISAVKYSTEMFVLSTYEFCPTAAWSYKIGDLCSQYYYWQLHSSTAAERGMKAVGSSVYSTYTTASPWNQAYEGTWNPLLLTVIEGDDGMGGGNPGIWGCSNSIAVVPAFCI